jgi:hypothetical protein
MCPIGDVLGDRFSGIEDIFSLDDFSFVYGLVGEAFGRGFSVFGVDF